MVNQGWGLPHPVFRFTPWNWVGRKKWRSCLSWDPVFLNRRGPGTPVLKGPGPTLVSVLPYVPDSCTAASSHYPMLPNAVNLLFAFNLEWVESCACKTMSFLLLFCRYSYIHRELLFVPYRNSSVEANYVYDPETGTYGYYYLSNFRSVISSYSKFKYTP